MGILLHEGMRIMMKTSRIGEDDMGGGGGGVGEAVHACSLIDRVKLS
jgi:hypothetical protein